MIEGTGSERVRISIDCGIPPLSAVEDSNLKEYQAGKLCKNCGKCLLSIYNQYDVCDLCLNQRLDYYRDQPRFRRLSHRLLMRKVLQDLKVSKREPIKRRKIKGSGAKTAPDSVSLSGKRRQ